MSRTLEYSRDITASREAEFMRRVYNWMLLGLALTGFMAWMVASSQSLLQVIFGNPILFYVLIGAELVMVFVLAGRAHRMSSAAAAGLFIAYSLLNGVTLSFIFLAYAHTTIASAFFVAAGTFAGMSVYGYTTKRDLSSWGGFLAMGLWGIILASIVNIFLASNAMYWVVTYAGVLIFTGLTAYDTQKLKAMASGGFGDERMESNAAVVGALSLYLDFINLFLMLLRIFGGSRD